MNVEQRIIQALEHRPLSDKELVNVLEPEGFTVTEIQASLYQLSSQKMWVVKHPVISGGCKTCACGVAYSWRLTLSGRQELAKVQGT